MFPLEQTRHAGVAKSEHTNLTNGELFSKNSDLCDHNSPTSQTDRQTTCDRNTALCTKVHRAVKTDIHYVNVRQPFVGLKNMMFSKCLSVMLGALVGCDQARTAEHSFYSTGR